MRMSEANWHSILKKLRENDPSLTKLDLYGEQIGAQRAKELALALTANHMLVELHLSKNNIGDEGAIALANALKYNCTLRKLNLISNRIQDSGAKALADALQVNHSLVDLYLGWNAISDEGATAIAMSLKCNFTLGALDFDCNQLMTEEGIMSLESIFKDNYSLTMLHLNYAYYPENFEEIVIYSDRGGVALAIKDFNFVKEINERNQVLKNVILKMHEAVKKGDISIVSQFLYPNHLLAVSGENNNTALHWAVIAQQPQMATYLIVQMRKSGISLVTKNRENKTAADLAKGTELARLFTSSQLNLSDQNKNKMVYTATQSFLSPPKNKNNEVNTACDGNHTLISKL